MKALILAGGRGKRLGKVSEGINKCMLPVRGRPLIEHSLDTAVRQKEITEVILVVGYRAEDAINMYGTSYKGTRVKYVIQWEPKGLVDAIDWARPVIGNDDIMLMLGDEIMLNPDHEGMLKKFKNENVDILCGVVEVKDKNLIKRTYSMLYEKDDRVIKLVEKPEEPFNNVMGTGNCVFRNSVLGYVESMGINSKRGEKELPDLIQAAVDDNKNVKLYRLCNKYINVNSPEEMQEVDSFFAHF
ncbi:MAG: sugar phosphate nucleotidyltransferase [Elusimicrobiota bacterium]